MSKWQPIETVPKDGTDIMLWFPIDNGMCAIGYWIDDKYHRNPAANFYSANIAKLGLIKMRRSAPTHWMPLPEPPK